MDLTLIRNATMKLAWHGLTLLTDPMLSEKGEIESFAGNGPNPTVDMSFTMPQVLEGIDGILASHIHQDHFDKAAFELIPKAIPIYCQPGDEERFRSEGFEHVNPIAERISANGLEISRTTGRHGSGQWEQQLGPVSGFVLKAPGEPCVYWAGDTVWCDEVAGAIDTYRPEIIVVHGSGAKLPGSGPIVMDDRQVVEVCRHAPDARIIAVHMEALDHATVSRRQLRKHAAACGVAEAQLIIPADGETIRLSKAD